MLRCASGKAGISCTVEGLPVFWCRYEMPAFSSAIFVPKSRVLIAMGGLRSVLDGILMWM